MTAKNQQQIAFLIADLSGYTALTEAHGDLSAAQVVERYGEIVLSALSAETELVERVGDEVLIASPIVERVIETAVSLRAKIEQEPLFPSMHVGLHAGTALKQGNRYFGSALNLTSRVAAYARGGQILCTDEVAARAQKVAGLELLPLGRVHFRNIVNPVAVFEIVTGDERREALVIDPVCRMQVNRETAPARLPFKNRSFYFCSFECARIFVESPERYATE
jgi:class 3 adenylate cyclase/YHS domain-containing protein